MNTLNTSIIAIAAMSLAPLASAGEWIVEDAPTWRGDAGSAYYLWDDFTAANGYTDGPNMPNNEAFPSGNAMLFNFADGAMIAGSGNLYGYGGALNIHTYLYTDADVQSVALNLSTAGTMVDYTSMVLMWTDGIEDGESGMLFADESINFMQEIPGMGYTVNASWNWDLGGIDADVRSLAIMFEGEGAHMSLDMVGVDILTAIPAPGALALLGLAGAATRRRRR